MKNEIDILLNRQSEWQKSRLKLSWGEKLRQSVILRETGAALRGRDYIECASGHVRQLKE